MRDHADLLVRRLLEGISSHPRVVGAKSQTWSVIKSLYYEEVRQAILDIEAEKRELRLCAGHRKAEKLGGCDEEGPDGPHFGGGLRVGLCEKFFFPYC